MIDNNSPHRYLTTILIYIIFFTLLVGLVMYLAEVEGLFFVFGFVVMIVFLLLFVNVPLLLKKTNSKNKRRRRRSSSSTSNIE